jgi:hypothetical protein
MVIMTRCVSVLLGYGWWASLLIIASFAVPVALLAMATAALFLRRPEAVQIRHRMRGQVASNGVEGVANAARQVVDTMGVVPGARCLPPEGLPRLEPTHSADIGGCLGCLALLVLGLSAWLLPRLIGPVPNWPTLGPDSGDFPPLRYGRLL